MTKVFGAKHIKYNGWKFIVPKAWGQSAGWSDITNEILSIMKEILDATNKNLNIRNSMYIFAFFLPNFWHNEFSDKTPDPHPS